jgi:adenine-specific DNA-methyltransferase
LDSLGDYVLWHAKDAEKLKYRPLFGGKADAKSGLSNYPLLKLPDMRERPITKEERSGSALPDEARLFGVHAITSARPPGAGDVLEYTFEGRTFKAGMQTFKTNLKGLNVLSKAARLRATTGRLGYVRYFDDFSAVSIGNNWTDTRGDMGMTYVVQTSTKIVERCVLMATDPGDLVLDPTCGSGTTAYVAEQWGRRWITMDTSRVALALARQRIMAARYPWYLLADSKAGRAMEAALTQRVPADTPVHHDIRQGFVYERVPRITLGHILIN